ncbi:MAG TPA: vitamin K epoxide reductase family protein [Polyangiaceae bacterium]
MKRGLVLSLAGLGLALSVVLEVLHVRAYLVPAETSFCAIGQRLDCTSVALSRYAVLAGLPLPVWGALGFLAIGLAAFFRSRLLLVLTAAASVASLALLGVELFAIGALCLLCEAVHVVAFASFGVALALDRGALAPFADRRKALQVFAPSALLAVGLLLFIPRYWAVFGWKGEPPFPHGKTQEGYPWIGAEEPGVTVHEFTDYRCVHCKAAASRSLRLLAQYPDTLRIVRRQFPRQRCPRRASFACLALRFAYCAGEQGKFWQADRWLFDRAGRRGNLESSDLVRDVGIDSGKFSVCLGLEATAERAAEEAQFALDQGYQGTPTLVVDGAVITEGELRQLVERGGS